MIRRCPSAFLPLLALLATTGVWAATVTVTVRDSDTAPVPNVVVTAIPATGTGKKSSDEFKPALMDQVDRQFAPYVVAIHTGSSVLFPNSDLVAHQVYSFSPTRRFELGLYRGKPHNPVVFDKPGIVVLGCNIHDNMIGYVYVTDAPYFGTTDARGQVQLAGVSGGSYTLEIWSPRATSRESGLRQTLQVSNDEALSVDFRFQHRLEPEPAPVREPRLRDY
ncbi:MAG TPA: methylamine utilization protein [Povalibacter sp.]